MYVPSYLNLLSMVKTLLWACGIIQLSTPQKNKQKKKKNKNKNKKKQKKKQQKRKKRKKKGKRIYGL